MKKNLLTKNCKKNYIKCLKYTKICIMKIHKCLCSSIKIFAKKLFIFFFVYIYLLLWNRWIALNTYNWKRFVLFGESPTQLPPNGEKWKHFDVFSIYSICFDVSIYCSLVILADLLVWFSLSHQTFLILVFKKKIKRSSNPKWRI